MAADAALSIALVGLTGTSFQPERGKGSSQSANDLKAHASQRATIRLLSLLLCDGGLEGGAIPRPVHGCIAKRQHRQRCRQDYQ